MTGYVLMVRAVDLEDWVPSAFGMVRPLSWREAVAALRAAKESPGAGDRVYSIVRAEDGGPVLPELAVVEARLRERFPGRAEDAYGRAAVRVLFELEVHGPVDDADRIVFGGGWDVDVLVDRALAAVRDRNAGVVGPSSGLSHAELEAEVERLRDAMTAARDLLHPPNPIVVGAVDVLTKTLSIDPTCSLCRAGHVPARACAPWAAEHVRESEELRS